MRKGILLLFIFVMITGCSQQTGEKAFNQYINQLEQSLDNNDFEALNKQVEEINKVYKKHEWKIQLLGDEGEYERLRECINRLITSIKSEEESDAKLELATLKTIVKDIYSL